MVERFISLSILTVLFAFSFLILLNLPTYIVGTDFEILIHVLWFLCFSMGYVKIGLQR